MFRSALIRLTLLYMVIIMAISFFFSLNLYRISAQEIGYNLTKQQNSFQRGGRLMPVDDDPFFIEEREQQIAEGQKRILWQLVYTNIFIFIAGGGISFLLARFTLRPIEKSHESQVRFTGDASHELRSPLAAMKSEIEVALRDPDLSRDEAVNILKSNLEEVDRLKALADGLLELANGKDNLSLSKINLHETVQLAFKNLSKQMKAHKAETKIQIPEQLTVLANRDSLVELLVILLDNALKYSNEEPVIKVQAKQSGRHVELSIIDNGIGISREDLPHIFERFYRSEPSRSKNKIQGYGLGLSIAEKIAHKNHGKIEVASELGKGTTFKVFLSLG